MMTEEQREFAEKNHNLIFSCANYYNIPIDEYYDLLAIGFCNAIMGYDSDKMAFSTYAYMCMRRVYLCHIRDSTRFKRIPSDKLVSFEDTLVEDSSKDFCLYDVVESGIDVENEAISGINLKAFNESLSDKEQKVLTLLNEGYSQSKIGIKLGISQASVSRIITSLKNRYINFCS